MINTKHLTLLLSLFIFSGCSENIKILENNQALFLHEADLELRNLKLREWNVGQKKNKIVHYGFSFQIDIPKIPKEDIKKLSSKYPELDALAYQVIRYGKSGKEYLQHLYLPFNRILDTTDLFTVHLYYHAATPTARYRLFKCPAMNHRLLIENADLESSSPKIGKVLVGPRKKRPIKLFALNEIPLIISGGLKLQGTYEVRIALYSTTDKKLYSDYIPLKNKIRIEREVKVPLPSCTGVREELQL